MSNLKQETVASVRSTESVYGVAANGKPGFFETCLIAYARKFPVRRGKLRVLNRLWRFAVGNHDHFRIANLQYGAMKMPCDLSQMLQRQFYFFGTYFLEEHLLSWWSTEATKADVIFDVGANSGIYSLVALSSQPHARVYAFEPTPEIASRIRVAAELNGLEDLYVCELAVSSDDGQAVLRRFSGELGTNEGMNFIVPDAGGTDVERVTTVSLDRFCEQQNIIQIDLLKIDVQGHEPSVLRGAGRLIAQGRLRCILMELNWAAGSHEPCSASEAIQLLETADYRFASPDRPDFLRESGKWMRDLTDVIARRMES